MSKNFINKEKVIIAMSGGVDSSVAAALLKERGYDVIGVTLRLFNKGKGSPEDAAKVANKLGIPHHVLDLRKEFKQDIIDYFIDEYKSGRTPNPCVKCNRSIKFEYLIRKADELKAEYVATGHYARVMTNDKCPMSNEGKYYLLKGKDKMKDQSYVLYKLDQVILARTIFPLGEITKEEARKKAKVLGLSVAEKEESQEICFIEHDDYAKFLRENCPELVKPGPILDKDGKVLGKHEGIAFYTIGQRKGIGAHKGEPKYVIKIDKEKNAVIIGSNEDILGNEVIASDVNYISGVAPKTEMEVTAKIRYNSSEAKAVLYPLENGKARIVFEEAQRAITPGQSVVFYNGEEVIGGGIINWNSITKKK